jgi:hypothetical protein
MTDTSLLQEVKLNGAVIGSRFAAALSYGAIRFQTAADEIHAFALKG